MPPIELLEDMPLIEVLLDIPPIAELEEDEELAPRELDGLELVILDDRLDVVVVIGVAVAMSNGEIRMAPT